MARLRAWIPFCAITLVILAFSTDLLTGDRVYVAIQDRVLSYSDDQIFHYGKVAFHKINHLLAFTVLALCTFPLRKKQPKVRDPNRGPRRALWCCAAVALGSELFQLPFNSRLPQVSDVAIDLAASLLGLRLLFAPPLFVQQAALRVQNSFGLLLAQRRARFGVPGPGS